MLLALPVTVGAASPVVAQVRAAVVQALGGAVQPSDVAVAADLKLEPCPDAPVAVAKGLRTVEVRCESGRGWKIFVPVKASQIAPVVVMAKPARAGLPIHPDQLTIQQRDVAMMEGPGFGAVELVAGKVATRGLPPGAVVQPADLADGVLVKRGDPVQIQATAGTITVKMEGRALGSATLGGQVNVENIATRRVLRGRLVQDGVVQVGH